MNSSSSIEVMAHLPLIASQSLLSSSNRFRVVPSVILRNMVTGSLPTENADVDIQNSIEFMMRKVSVVKM